MASGSELSPPTHPQAIDRLSLLPEEIVDNICGHLLDKSDIHGLRLTCKHLHAFSKHAFAKKHFGVILCNYNSRSSARVGQLTLKTVGMTIRHSFERVLEIAKDENFCVAIRELEIFPFLLHTRRAPSFFTGEPQSAEELQELLDIRAGIEFEDLRRPAQDLTQEESKEDIVHPKIRDFRGRLLQQRRRSYAHYKSDQEAMISSGVDVELVVKILSLLPSLKSVKVVDYFDKTNPPLGTSLFRHDTRTANPVPVHYDSYEHNYLQLGAYSVATVLGALLRSKTRLETLAFCKVPYPCLEGRNATSRKSSLTPASCLAQYDIADLDLSAIREFSLEAWSFQYTLTDHNGHATPTDWFVPLVTRLTSVRNLTISTTLSITGDDYIHLLAHIDPFALHKLYTLEVLGRRFSSANIRSLIVRFGTTLRRLTIWQESSLDDQPVSALPLLKGLPCMVFFQFTCWPYKETVISGETVDEFQASLLTMGTEYDEVSYSETSESEEDQG